MKPGRYTLKVGPLEWRAIVFEDLETFDLLVRFEGSNRVHRMDEFPKVGVEWLGRRSATAA